jgi:hypothetical protein
MTDGADPVEPGASVARPISGQGRVEASTGLEFERLQLLTRLLLGSLSQGSGELMERLRDLEREIQAEPDLPGQESGPVDETVYDLLRYLGIGLLARGETQIGRRARRGYYFSLGVTSWFIEQVDRATDNVLVRPVRRPIESRIRNLWEQIGLVAEEGKQEEQTARLLTRRAVFVTLDELVDSLAESPELADLIKRQTAQRSAGLGQVAVDNTRRATVRADDLAEGLVRRLLRRRPRQELPRSPLLGEPQTMYSLEARGQEIEEHGR